MHVKYNGSPEKGNFVTELFSWELKLFMCDLVISHPNQRFTFGTDTLVLF